MSKSGTRRRNAGIRKRCGCRRKDWPKCKHPWHLNFKFKGTHYRLSLDREVGHPITNRTDAERAAEGIRTAIREGTFRAPEPPAPEVPVVLTFSEFRDLWQARKGAQLANAKDNGYRLTTIVAFAPIPGVVKLGDMHLPSITTDHIEQLREHRRGQGRSAVTVNHDLKLLRKMFAWGVRAGYLERSPFKIGTEPAIALDREIPRDKRFEQDEDEEKLLRAANPHLRGVIIAMLDTACRPGEILSVQWKDVNLPRKEMVIRAEKSKTRTARLVPLSTRLLATLEMRRLDPAGQDHKPEAYVFGDALGQRVKSVRTAWVNACEAAGVKNFQLRDLRHESGSRFDEAGVPISYVSKLLGHTNLTTTSRYLNIHRRGLHSAMAKLEAHRESVAQALHTEEREPQASVQEKDSVSPAKPLAS
jgi:integrase